MLTLATCLVIMAVLGMNLLETGCVKLGDSCKLNGEEDGFSKLDAELEGSTSLDGEVDGTMLDREDDGATRLVGEVNI